MTAAHDPAHAGLRAAAPSSSAGAGRWVFLAGAAVLVATTVTLAIAAIAHLSGAGGPVLPVSLCRSGSEVPLPPLRGGRWLSSWQPDWVALLVIAAVAAVYLSGVYAIARRGRRWPTGHTLCFLAGLAVLVLATCGSIAVYDMAMFSSHMLGHLALVMIAPPLLVLGRPVTLALHATRNPWHRRIRTLARGRALAVITCPPVALAGYAVVIVGTHLTGLMDEIMTRPWAGQLEHLAYLLVGCQFFVLVVGDEPLRWRLSMPAKQLLLAVAMAIDTFTGVVLLQSTRAISMTGLSPAHLDPLAQTRLGGAIMWVGGDGVMAVLMMGVTLAWLRLPEARKRASRSWLEQARRATFEDRISATGRSIDADLAPRTTHTTGGSGRARAGIDDDEAARIAYNAWLTRIAHNPAAG